MLFRGRVDYDSFKIANLTKNTNPEFYVPPQSPFYDYPEGIIFSIDVKLLLTFYR